MKNTLKKSLLLFITVTFVVSCKDNQSLETTCRELSVESGVEQVLMSGEVLHSQLSIPSPVMCDRTAGDCSEVTDIGVSARMRFLSNNGDKFIVHTKKENYQNLSDKELYLVKGKKYKFCAVYLAENFKPHKTRYIYRIEDVETIKEID